MVQLLETNFPGRFVAFRTGEGSFLQIVENDEDQREMWSLKIADRQAACNKQNGFCWIIEALLGNDFADAITAECQKNVGGANAKIHFTTDDLAADLKAMEQRLKQRRPVLVGHNQFMDLCFLYSTFFCPLPESMDEFKENIQLLFPRMVDTKYMLTRGTHSMSSEDNLERLFAAAAAQPLPKMACDAVFGYNSRSQAHQAGFDSKTLAPLRPCSPRESC